MKILCNIRYLLSEYNKEGANFIFGIKASFGVIFALGLLLTIGSWQFNFVNNLVTAIMSFIIISGAFVSLTAYPISQIIYQGEPKPQHLYAVYANKE